MTREEQPGAVLVVEDDRSLANLYSQFLESEFTVKTALDGSEGLELMDDEVDVVLLDRRMPGLSGSEVLEKLRLQFDRCQIAMVTAVDPDIDVLEMEFDEYIVKPTSREELIELVEQLLIRASYDDDIRRYMSLASKRAALEVNKSSEELETHDEYLSLKEELDQLGSKLHEDLTKLDETGFEALFHDLN